MSKAAHRAFLSIFCLKVGLTAGYASADSVPHEELTTLLNQNFPQMALRLEQCNERDCLMQIFKADEPEVVLFSDAAPWPDGVTLDFQTEATRPNDMADFCAELLNGTQRTLAISYKKDGLDTVIRIVREQFDPKTSQICETSVGSGEGFSYIEHEFFSDRTSMSVQTSGVTR